MRDFLTAYAVLFDSVESAIIEPLDNELLRSRDQYPTIRGLAEAGVKST